MKLEGYAAIEFAEANDLLLNKYNDPTEDAREGLTPDEARAVAREDARLIWIEPDLLVIDPGTDAAEMTAETSMTRAQAEKHLASLGFREMAESGQAGNYLHPDGRQARITYDYDRAERDGVARIADGYYVVEISPIRMSQPYVAATTVR